MRWRMEEDKILRTCVEQYTETGSAPDWSSVAAQLPNRSNKDCRKRWVNHACGGLKKGPWEPNEDVSLRDAVATHGHRWVAVAEALGTRSADQCAKRWQHSLDPRLGHRQWTPKEDELLLQSVARFGRQWRKIQKTHYSTRSANDLKNRFTTLSKIPNRVAVWSADGLDNHCSDSSAVSMTCQSQHASAHSLRIEGLTPMTGEMCGPAQALEDMPARVHDASSRGQSPTQYPGMAWPDYATSSSVTSPHEVAAAGSSDALISNDLATMMQQFCDPDHTNMGNSDGGGNMNQLTTTQVHSGSSTGELFSGLCDVGTAADSPAVHDFNAALTLRASKLVDCKQGGCVHIEAENCDDEVLNYLLEVLLPVRQLVDIKMNV